MTDSAPRFELDFVRRQIEEAAIVVHDTDQLVAYARNARTHSDYQVHLIAESIKKWGFTAPVLIDENGGIIAGHGRVLAAYKLGLERVPCRVLGYLDERQKQAYILADNKLAEKAGWDFDMLRQEIEEIATTGYDPVELGFELSEFKSFEHLETQKSEESFEGAKELSENDFMNFDHQCPKCGFEFNGKK
jgi:ParB-like chromosome segregation protein Spo0J